MAEAQVVSVKIRGQRYPISSALDAKYVNGLATYVDEQMRAAASENAARPLLKVKLGTDDDTARIEAVREGAPRARLIVDANEGWRADSFERNMAACLKAGVELVEQPLPSADDAALLDLGRPVPVCADESLHDRASLARLAL